VRRSVHEAMERGVVFDVGHGQGSFSWDVVEQAMAQGVQPQTISSDLHVYNVDGPVYDLASVVSKFLHLGLPLEEAMAKVTATPARVLAMSDRLGTLAVGAWGDAAVFDLHQGQFRLVDSYGQVRTGREKLVPVAVVKGGRIYSSSIC
jgi:dihydroorotase